MIFSKRLLILLFCAICSTIVWGQKKPIDTPTELPNARSQPALIVGGSFFQPKSEFAILSTSIEFAGHPSSADISFLHFTGAIALHWDINRAVYVGPYFRSGILSTSNYQTIRIDSQVVDVQTLKEWGAGLDFGTYVRLNSKFLLVPECRVGFHEYTLLDTGYTSANKKFTHRSYVLFTPRFHLAYKLSEYATCGLALGYQLPFYLQSKKETTVFDPSGPQLGLNFRFYLNK